MVIDLQKVFYEVQKTIPAKDLAINGIYSTKLGHKIMADAIEKELELSAC